MKTLSNRNTAKKNKATVEVNQAMREAFQELYNRTAEESKAAQAKRRAEKYKQWQGAAKRFKGLSEALRLQIESRNIRLAEGGYRVSFMRGGETFTRHFHGQSEETLSAAVKFRDEALKILGPGHTASVPASVLKALDLPAPVPGILRDATASAYVVHAKDAKNSGLPRKFSFQFLAEEDAYAAAIECLEASLKSK